jgi:hypothetical protein
VSDAFTFPRQAHPLILSHRLGLIMKITHGANFSALWEGLRYMYNICSIKRTSYKPGILRRAVFILALGLGFAHSFVVLDIALSISSKTMSFSQLGDYSGTWPLLSRQINSSMCATTSDALAPGVNLCDLQVPGYVFPLPICSFLTFHLGSTRSPPRYQRLCELSPTILSRTQSSSATTVRP